MKVLTRSELVNMIRNNVKGTSHITVELDSDMDGKGKMRKTNNPFWGKGIVKRETLNGTIGYIYANSVNRQAKKENKDEREVKKHPWGDMDEKNLFRVHRKTGDHYLSMQIKNVKVAGFFDPDNNEIPAEEIRPFIPKKKKSSTQADLNKEVIVRDYSLKNIKAIRAFGDSYYVYSDSDITEMEKTEVIKNNMEEIKICFELLNEE